MATGTPYVPPTLSTTWVAPQTQVQIRNLPYVSNSEYMAAPTAVGTAGLAPMNPDNSPQVLADVLERASEWADLHAFHTSQGTFAAGPTTETMRVTVKPNGAIGLTCNQTPVLEITGLALGSQPGNLASINTNTVGNLWIDNRVIWIPGGWTAAGNDMVWFPPSYGAGASIYAAWTYIGGYPHAKLADGANIGDTHIDLTPAIGTSITGIYAGTSLLIVDGPQTETVFVTATPTNNTVPVSPLANFHNPPATGPDFIPVTAIPRSIEQAVIFLTNVLIKTRGSRAMVLPGAPGSIPTRTAMAQSGALDDYDNACRLLHRFILPTLH